jgi:predicted enzyme related to lactoylglutathione lyase
MASTIRCSTWTPRRAAGRGCAERSAAFGLDFQANNHPIALRVDDVEAARTELESRGVAFKGDILDSGVCHQAFFEDPDGNALALHHRYAPRT